MVVVVGGAGEELAVNQVSPLQQSEQWQDSTKRKDGFLSEKSADFHARVDVINMHYICKRFTHFSLHPLPPSIRLSTRSPPRFLSETDGTAHAAIYTC